MSVDYESFYADTPDNYAERLDSLITVLSDTVDACLQLEKALNSEYEGFFSNVLRNDGNFTGLPPNLTTAAAYDVDRKSVAIQEITYRLSDLVKRLYLPDDAVEEFREYWANTSINSPTAHTTLTDEVAS